MAHCTIFSNNHKRSQLIIRLVHDPIKKLVKKSGWHVRVHMFDDNSIQVLLHTKAYKDRIFFRCNFNDMPKLMVAVVIRLYQITNLKY